MRLTKKKALQITADLFGWLEKHPSKEKWHWSGWKSNGGDIPEMDACCACCEYINLYDVGCRKCPLIKLWPTNKDNSTPCLYGKYGYFGKWDDAESPKTRKKYARIIKEGALKELSCLNAN